MKIVDRVTERFRDTVGEDPRGVWSAPGHVTVVGEHTDYNGGLALTVAIDRHAVVAVGIRDDGLVRVMPPHRSDSVTVELSRCVPGSVSGWAAYPLGVLWALGNARGGMPGLDIVIDTDVTAGTTMASTSEIQCVVAIAVNDLWDLGLGRVELAYAVQRAESDMVGVSMGIVNQMATLFGGEDRSVFIDCQLPEASAVPFALESEGLALFVIHANGRATRTSNDHQRQRTICDDAARAMGVDQLRDLAVDDLPKLRASVNDETFRYARHVVTENARVAAVTDLLRHDGVNAIGDFLVASHLSMKNDANISEPQFDLAVDIARENGALGARLTDDGMGSAVIALAPRDRMPSIHRAVRQAFSTGGYGEPEFSVVTPTREANRVY